MRELVEQEKLCRSTNLNKQKGGGESAWELVF